MLLSQRLVLDANVIVSSVLSAQGRASHAFDLAIATGIVLMSDDTIDLFMLSLTNSVNLASY
jgi:predicted nucleic acid-binding protein